MPTTKYIFVTGGVLSGVGKGIVAASIGNIMQTRGYSVFMQKFDPYLNVDAGTLNPAEHGECFVTADGAEADLDLGHYERFTDIEFTKDSSIMSGVIYQAVINKERQGHYLGKTVQVIPHITNEVKERLFSASLKNKPDIHIVEIGGTIGDIEGRHFIEAIRQVGMEKGRENVAFAHVGFIPYLKASNELKSKPMQNSLHELQAIGIHPDFVFCRADYPIHKDILTKISLFGGIPFEAVVPMPTVETIYEVPLILKKYEVDKQLLKQFKIRLKNPKNGQWHRLVKRIKRKSDNRVLKVGMVGKYMTMADTYFSVVESLKAASWQTPYNIEIKLINSEEVEEQGIDVLKELDGIVAPGGFGKRGVEGIISAIKFARENHIPYLGLCFGMQLACVEYARNVLNMEGANSTEIDPGTNYPVINIMSDQEKKMLTNDYGGSMRLGNYPCKLNHDSKSFSLYNCKEVQERHRHRYEFNNEFREKFLERGEWIFAGASPDDRLIELIELNDHPYFVASQFHPEFKSRPNKPHPLFVGFIKACIQNSRNYSFF